jgi:hypothetical protein
VEPFENRRAFIAIFPVELPWSPVIDEHASNLSSVARADPGGAIRKLFLPVAIGAGCGGILLVIAVLALTGEDPRNWVISEDLRDWNWWDFGRKALLPAGLGSLAGSALVCATWVTRMKRRVALPWLVLSWGLLGGAVALLVSALPIFVFMWVRGERFDLAGPGGHVPMPMTMEAAGEALAIVGFLVVPFGIPVLAIGWLGGAVVALVKWASRRNPLVDGTIAMK